MAERKKGPSLLVLRSESGRVLSPVDLAGRIENMVETAEGTLRTVEGPCPYVPSYGGGGGYPAAGDAPPNGAADVFPLTYGAVHGIFHARLRRGARDVLLLHTGDQLWEYVGPQHRWRVLLGPSGLSPAALFVADLPDDGRVRFPTQFEATATGIVIVPQDGRAFFYDGVAILPLGYDRAPGPPTGHGPGSSSTEDANDTGYAHDRNPEDPWTGAPGPTEMLFGHGKIGTVEGSPDPEFGGAGWLLNGQWWAATQWVDRWGNLSPVSRRSAPISVQRQRSADPAGDLHRVDLMRKQFAWSGIDVGPVGTIGRILCRTKDVLHAGTERLFEVPPDLIGAEGAFATLPDNSSTLYPDNVPDAALLVEPLAPVAVPLFRLCRTAFGRLFIANSPEDPGMLRASMPGRWGTFLPRHAWWPDASGAQITGLWRTALGLLVFTESSTFLVRPSEVGDDFVVATLHPEIGCVAPNSVGTLPSGLTVWLGREGFYGWDGTAITLVSEPIATTVERLNKGRLLAAVAAVDVEAAEYRCWVPQDDDNALCLVFNGAHWRRRTDVAAVDVCVTRDHRRLMVAAGRVGDDVGPWVLDHGTAQFPRANVGVVETAWISARDSETKKSFREVRLWLREEQVRPVKVEVMADWRELPVVETHTRGVVPDDEAALLYREEDPPGFWGTTLLDGGATWMKRRPLWRRVHISVPSAEVIKVRLSSPPTLDGEEAVTAFEFIGIEFESEPWPGSGRMPP